MFRPTVYINNKFEAALLKEEVKPFILKENAIKISELK
jgi:hypothetical protein